MPHSHLLMLMFSIYIIFFPTLLVSCTPLQDVQFLCDLFNYNRPSSWWNVTNITSPCNWTTPCEQDLNGAACMNSSLILLYVNSTSIKFVKVLRQLSGNYMNGSIPESIGGASALTFLYKFVFYFRTYLIDG